MKKLFGFIVVGIGSVLLVALLLALPPLRSVPQQYGVTFSQPHATGLGLDWQDTLEAILTDLGVKKLRLVAYWHLIEPRDGVFDFTDLDHQFEVAAEHDAQIVLAVGRKVPRWPECHIPEWASELPEAEQQERVRIMLREVVTHYKDHPSLTMWQLENEPLLDFGICPPADPVFLASEQDIIRSLDNRPILITDSGELNWWLSAAHFGDVLGTTMYRTVFSGRTEKLFHYDYILPAWVYRAKGRLVQYIRHHDVLISELQGEPWGAKPFIEMTPSERAESVSVERLHEIQQFAQRTNIPLAYWWGVEYWYWEKEKQANAAYWDAAKSFFKEN